MDDPALGFLREARAALREEGGVAASRAVSIALDCIDTAILWRQEDLMLRRPPVNEEAKQPDGGRGAALND